MSARDEALAHQRALAVAAVGVEAVAHDAPPSRTTSVTTRTRLSVILLKSMYALRMGEAMGAVVRGWRRSSWRNLNGAGTGLYPRRMAIDREDPGVYRGTLEHYNSAPNLLEGTRDHDVSQNIDALLRHIEARRPFTILDFGCGPGRDLARFRELGHAPVGLEGAARLAAMARAHGGCEVWEQDFLALDLPPARFDGIFANASLFHVPRRSCRACSPSSMRRCSRAACSSAPIRAATTRRAGTAGATAPGTTSRHGAVPHCRGVRRARALLPPAGLPRSSSRGSPSVWRKS
jgi:SAM-dependent methyltransferase